MTIEKKNTAKKAIVVPKTRSKAPSKPKTVTPKPTPRKAVKKAVVAVDAPVRKRHMHRDYNFTFHIEQKDLQELTILAPLSIKQEKYLNDNENDIIVWGGAASAGKTQLSLLKILLSAQFDKDFVGGIARRSQKQMKQAGSLWSTGVKLYAPFGVSSNRLDLAWNFPSGAEVKCHHLDNNQDDWQGTQFTKAIVDEAQQCEEDDIWYLTSRLRSASKQKHQLLLTCNPLNTSFLCRWLEQAGYLLESGLPDPTQDGVSKFMVQVGGKFEWFNTKKEIIDVYGKSIADIALRFTYYSANVYDNPYIRKYLPAYVHKLENLKHTDRERLLLGNWYARMDGIGYAKKELFRECSGVDIPLSLPFVRAWDLAGTKPNPTYPNPDWTRGVKGTYDKVTGHFYITAMASIRDVHALVQAFIETTAEGDGKSCYISIPIDAGSAGKVVADQKKARLMQMGHRVILEPTRKAKLVRAEPFLIALQEGKVFVLPGVFNEEHFREIESFDGAKCSGAKDDIIDAMASCYNNLVSGSLIPTIKLGGNLGNKSFKRVGGYTLL